MTEASVMDIAIPVIIGGITGMTLSVTGVDKIYDLCEKAFNEIYHLGETFNFTTTRKEVVENSIILVFLFFLAESVSLLSLLLNNIWVAYTSIFIIFIATGFLLHTYRKIKNRIRIPPPKYENPIIKQFEDYTEYPSLPPHPP